MKFITSSTEFFELHNNPKLIKLREAISAVPIENWNYISTLKFKPAREISKQEAWAITSHQLYLLENFDSISEINRNESLLNRYGYTPVSLTLEGAYLETLNSIKSLNSLNESLASSVKDFLLLMTDGGDAIGIVHFILDIMSLIPTSWFLFPFDVVASLLNALIYIFQDKPSYIMAAINILFAFAGPIGAALKVGVKPFIVGAEKFFSLIFKGASSSAVKLGAMEFKTGALVIDKSAAAAGGIIPKLGGMLNSIGKFLLTTGLAIIRSLLVTISKILEVATFGAVKLPTRAIKWTEELIIKITAAGKAATEAGELLIKEDSKLLAGAAVTADAGSIAAKDAATVAGKSADEVIRVGDKTAKSLGELNILSKDIKLEIQGTAAYKEFILTKPAASIEKLYLDSVVTEKLIGGVLNSKSATSIVNLMKDPKITSELVRMGWKPGEAALVSAIKTGDSAAISKLFKEMSENPIIMEHIILNEPKVAKTLSIFKEAPDALISGTKNLKKIQKTIARLTGYRGTSLRVLIAFTFKQIIKGECGKLLIHGSPSEILSRVSSTASSTITSAAINELLSKIVINEDTDPLSNVSGDEIEKFKTNHPEAGQILSDKVEAAASAKSQIIKETNPNPCKLDSTKAETLTGVVYMHKAFEKGRVVTNLITDKDFADANLAEYSKTFLGLIKQDTNIDPQHPISSTDPVHIGYISDVFNYKDGILLVNEGPSNLDETLDFLIKDEKLSPNRREAVKQEIIKHWKDGTIPDSFGLNDINLDESFFKIGKLITNR